MAQPKFANLMALTTAAAILGACTQSSLSPNTTTTAMDGQGQGNTQAAAGQPAQPAKAFNRFPDIPVPTGAEMDVKRTIVFGSGESWYGQLGLNTQHDTDAMFDFYKQELPGFGWQEITSVRALVSVLTYERQGRVLSIQLEKATLSGAKVTLTISPRGNAASNMAPNTGGAGTPPPAVNQPQGRNQTFN